MPSDGDEPGDDGTPSDDEVVTAAVDAAEDLIFSRYSASDVRDVDVTVRFEAGRLEVDVYLNAPDAADEERVANDAALAARNAVDRLLEG